MAACRKYQVLVTVSTINSKKRLLDIFGAMVSAKSDIEWNSNWCVGIRAADIKEAGRTVRAKRPVQQPQGEICCMCKLPFGRKRKLVSTAGNLFCIKCYNKLSPVR